MEDGATIMLRNMLLGQWAAEKLQLGGDEAKAYAEQFARRALAEGGDLFGAIRKAFDDVGVMQSDEQILSAMHECAIKAGSLRRPAGDASPDAAGLKIKRNLLRK